MAGNLEHPHPIPHSRFSLSFTSSMDTSTVLTSIPTKHPTPPPKCTFLHFESHQHLFFIVYSPGSLCHFGAYLQPSERLFLYHCEIQAHQDVKFLAIIALNVILGITCLWSKPEVTYGLLSHFEG